MSQERAEPVRPEPRTVYPGRIVGIDVARGLAILGMMAVHLVNPGPFPWIGWMPDDWDQTARGRSAILFAVIAGVSIAIISGRNRPYTGVPLLQARMRIMVRAVVIFAVGSVLAAVPHPIAVILEVYAVLFVLALPFLSVPPKVLFPIVAVMAFVMPVLTLILQNLEIREELGEPSTITRLFVTGTYPATTWIVYVLLGLAVGRLDLGSAAIRLRLFLVGLVLAIVGTTTGTFAEREFGPDHAVDVDVPGRFGFSRMWTTEPHTETWFEVARSCGIALVILIACIVIAPHARRLLYPLAAAGSMALTVYTLHVVSVHWIWDHLTLDNQYSWYLWSVAAALAGATLWKLAFGQGPLERILSWLSWRAARV